MRRRESPTNPSPSSVVCGVRPVLEALRSAPRDVERVWLVPSARTSADIAAVAHAGGVAVEHVERAVLDRLTGGAHHQGVAARARPFSYVDVDVLFEATGSGRVLVALDGVTDPGNLGGIIRSAEVLGASGLILPKDRAAAVGAAAIRASAGAALHLPVAQVVNLPRALGRAKELGYWVIGLDVDGTTRFRDLPALDRAVLVVGSEGRGARRLVVESCDFLVRIPVRGAVASLNVSVAAAIGLHEVMARMQEPNAEPGDS